MIARRTQQPSATSQSVTFKQNRSFLMHTAIKRIMSASKYASKPLLDVVIRLQMQYHLHVLLTDQNSNFSHWQYYITNTQARFLHHSGPQPASAAGTMCIQSSFNLHISASPPTQRCPLANAYELNTNELIIHGISLTCTKPTCIVHMGNST